MQRLGIITAQLVVAEDGVVVEHVLLSSLAVMPLVLASRKRPLERF